MKKLLLSFVALATLTTVNAQVDTLTEFFTGTPTLYSTAGGYVTGTNEYGDLGKYQRFDNTNGLNGNGNITGCLLWAPVKVDNGGSFDVVVIDFAGGAAGSVLATETINLADLDTTTAAHGVAEGAVLYNFAVNFSTPVAFTSTSDLLIGVNLPTTAGDTLALVSNTVGDYASATTYTWEQWSDNSFVAIGDPNNWDATIAQAIFPTIEGDASISELEANTTVYPNPANDVLNVKTTEVIETISIITTEGKVVATANNATSINVAELTAGMYIYEVKTVSGQVVRNTFMKK